MRFLNSKGMIEQELNFWDSDQKEWNSGVEPTRFLAFCIYQFPSLGILLFPKGFKS